MGSEASDERTSKNERPLGAGPCITASLHSGAFHTMQISIRFLILAEAHFFVKKVDSHTHLALKALRYERCFVLSGTFVPHKWSEVFGIMDFLPQPHPFDQSVQFWKSFGSHGDGGRRAYPIPTKMNRLIKLLQARVMSRPAPVNTIPGMQKHTSNFNLSSREAALDIWWDIRFLFVLKLKEDVRDIEKSDGDGEALSQWQFGNKINCTYLAIVPENVKRLEDEILKTA